MATAVSALLVADDRIWTSDMLRKIFRHFDEDGDGGLDRREMAALVLALNPGIKFTREQIGVVVDQVFQFYSKADCVTLGSLLCIYDDIAGDVHGDFDALFLGHLVRHDSSSSPENREYAEVQEGDVGYLPPLMDRLPDADHPYPASSPSRSEDDPSEFDYDGCSWPLDVSPSFRWLLSRGAVAGDEPEGDVAHLSTPTEPDRLPSTNTSRDSPLNSEDESSEADYGGGPTQLGTGEPPSLRWMLSPYNSTQRGTSDPPSLASSSLTSEAESSDRDVGGYPPQAELEEIPSPTFRWPSPPATPLQKGAWYAPPPTEDARDHDKGRGNSSSSWAGIRKLGTFYRLRSRRRKS